MTHRKCMMSFMAAVLLSSTAYAQKGKAGTLSTQDYVEIQQLYARHAWAIDTHDEKGATYAKTFTPDGEYVLNGKQLALGAEKLAEMVANVPREQARPGHSFTNILIQPAPEGAHSFAYNGTSSYEDIVVRTPDGWRFKQRKQFSGAMPPAGPFAH